MIVKNGIGNAVDDNTGRVNCDSSNDNDGSTGGGCDSEDSNGGGTSESSGGGAGINYSDPDCWLIIKSVDGVIINMYVTCGDSSLPNNRVECLPSLPDSNNCTDDDCPPEDPIPVLLDPTMLWSPAQTFGKLCAESINFKYSANSFTAEIQQLGATYVNFALNKVISVEFDVNCIDLPEYHIGTSYDASEGFAQVFNEVRLQIERELDAGTLAPTNIAVRGRMILLLEWALNERFSGATFGLGPCQGNIPASQADYSC